MPLPQLVQHVGGVKPRIVSKLVRDDLQSSSKGGDEELAAAGDAARVVPARVCGGWGGVCGRG